MSCGFVNRIHCLLFYVSMLYLTYYKICSNIFVYWNYLQLNLIKNKMQLFILWDEWTLKNHAWPLGIWCGTVESHPNSSHSFLVLNPTLVFTVQYLVSGAEERRILRETQVLGKAKRWRNLWRYNKVEGSLFEVKWRPRGQIRKDSKEVAPTLS